MTTGGHFEPIVLGEPRMTPQEFYAKWASAELKERAGAQEHFIRRG